MEDTIAAIATAFGEGGIGIVRISGDDAKSILSRIFVPASKSDAGIINRKMAYGVIVDPESGRMIDEVLAVYMKAPYTFTREDVVEINCHGSIVSLGKTLQLVLSSGARLADPGEFTKRAFLNGRIDLAQAESVIDLIKAKSDRSFETALQQLEGSLSGRVRVIREELMDVLVQITVNLDYPDEDIEEIVYDKLQKDLTEIKDKIKVLLDSADTGRIIREGLRIAIVGKPNVGKSSLMNALLRDSRAIVTDIPGTTRDTIEEGINIKGIPVYLTDTAGIRDTDDSIEKIGIEKSKEAFNKADLVLFMIDGSRELSDEDREIAVNAKEKKVVVLLNKKDLDSKTGREQVKEILPDAEIINMSIKEDEGVSYLEEYIEKLVYAGKVKQEESLLVTNVRHKDLLAKAYQAIEDSLSMIENQEALDFIEVDIKSSWEYLGEIIGETAGEDIINTVFERFCLGK